MTAFRKVSVKERLPNSEVFCIDKNGMQACGYLYVDTINNSVYCQDLENSISDIEYWLEEIELPMIGNNSILELFK